METNRLETEESIFFPENNSNKLELLSGNDVEYKVGRNSMNDVVFTNQTISSNHALFSRNSI